MLIDTKYLCFDYVFCLMYLLLVCLCVCLNTEKLISRYKKQHKNKNKRYVLDLGGTGSGGMCV